MVGLLEFVEAMLGKAVVGLSEADYSRFLNQAIDGFKKGMPTSCNGKYWEHSTKRIWVNARKPK